MDAAMRAQHDTTAAYMPAISALRARLACLEQQSSRLRVLLEGLEGLIAAGEPAATPRRGAVPSSASTPTSLALSDSDERTYTTKHGAKPKKTAAPAKSNDDKASAAELSEVVAVIAEAAERVAAAKRDNDAKKLQSAVAAGERAERRAGALLAAMNGRVRRLPGEDKDKRRWRAAVLLSAEDFEIKVRRSQRRALAEIGVGPPLAKAKATTRPKQAMRISDWQHDPADGALTRTVTAVDDDGAAAAASGG
jgi:hypothetical protein